MSDDDREFRTIVFGFDALDFRYLDRYSESLPNIERFRDEGVEAQLRSTFPPWTGSAWPSMYTGVDPSHHGVYGFFRYDGYPDRGELVSRNDVEAPAIWNYLSTQGDPSVVLNVPVTHPAEPIEGVIIPGYIAREDTPGYPVDIRDDVSDAIGQRYRIYSRAELSTDENEKLDGYLELIDLRKRAAIHLLTEREWAFALIQIQKTDAVVHNFNKDTAIKQVFAAADDLMGSVLDEIDEPVNLVVCSDHGIGPVDGYRIFVNELLRRGGYLETSEGESEPSFAAKKSDLVGETSEHRGEKKRGDWILSRLAKTLSQVGVTPNRVFRLATSLGIPPRVFKRMPKALRRSTSKRVDWRRSRAYCRRPTRLGVRINLEGREPDGIVAPSEYEGVQSEIIDMLSGVKTPDGKPAFDFVVRREEFYDGPFANRGPDVLVCPREMDNRLSTELYGSEFIRADRRDHKLDGVFLASGPAFDEGFEVDRLSLTDVAPIVMTSMGNAVPERMMGTVPPGLVAWPIRERQFGDVPFGKGSLTGQESDVEVTERLEDLGYL